MTEYRVFAGAVQDTKCRHTYVGSHCVYMLVFDDKKPKGNFTELTADDIKDLTASEKEWITECRKEIAEEEMLLRFTDCLITELKAEIRKHKRRHGRYAKRKLRKINTTI